MKTNKNKKINDEKIIKPTLFDFAKTDEVDPHIYDKKLKQLKEVNKK